MMGIKIREFAPLPREISLEELVPILQTDFEEPLFHATHFG